MPLLFAVYLAAVPRLAVDPSLLFGFLLVLDAGSARDRGGPARGVDARDRRACHAARRRNLAGQYPSGALTMATLFTAFRAALCRGADDRRRLNKSFDGVGLYAIYAAPILLFVFPVLARIEPAAASPWLLSARCMLLALLAWRALAIPAPKLFFISAFFALAAEASWSATHLLTERLLTAVMLYALFGLFYLGVPSPHGERNAARAAVGRRCGRLRQPRHAALSRCRPESGSGPLGPGLPAGPAQRRVVRRKRRRPSATAVGRRKRIVVAGARRVVGQRRGHRRHHAIADCARRPDARDVRRPCVGARGDGSPWR